MGLPFNMFYRFALEASDVFLQDDGRLVGELGFAQPLDAKVLFPVEVGVLWGYVVGKFVVDHGVCSLNACVGLLHMYSKGVLVDG